MSVYVEEQVTPNPNAMKYVTSRDVLVSGKITFQDPSECADVPMACVLFQLEHVSQIHLFENVVTVTHDGQANWDTLGPSVIDAIRAHVETHDPRFNEKAEAERQAELNGLPEDVQQINKILDEYIRPALQGDGGDLTVVRYDTETHKLFVSYEGACGSCPSSTTGTLMAIQGILADEFDPDIDVVAVDGEPSYH
jgi:Fe-S cluster biogenesis protein NfuA|tara:strand:- start:4498 stop:5082 length:585 start_codon:yes stop_codon:yes gene_type:complete